MSDNNIDVQSGVALARKSAGGSPGRSAGHSSGRSSGQVEVVTVLRGFAATCVFLFHLVCVSNGYISGKYLNAVFQYGKYGVQFFFVISGFVIPYSMMKSGYRVSDFFRFFQKRVVRIEPPYLVVVLLTVCFLYLRHRVEGGGAGAQLPSWQQVALHIGYLIPFSHYDWLSIVFWTLAIEFQFYLIFSLAYPLLINNQWVRRAAYIVLVACAFLLPDNRMFLSWSPIFLMGIHTALFKLRRVNAADYWVTIAFLAAIVFYKLGWEVGVFALAAVLMIEFEPVIRNRVLHFLGDISYSLYLSHTLVAFAVINLGIRFTKNIYQKAFFITAAIAATLVFSYLLYYFIERPAKRWASAIKYRHE